MLCVQPPQSSLMDLMDAVPKVPADQASDPWGAGAAAAAGPASDPWQPYGKHKDSQTSAGQYKLDCKYHDDYKVS